MDLPIAPFYRRWSFILAGVIGLAAITALVGWRGLQQVDPPATTGTTVPATTIASTTTTTTTPPPSIEPTSTSTKPLWDIQSGKGTATSDGFRAPAVWRIVWSFDCSNFKRLGGGNFKITGTGAFERVDIQELDVKASDTRTFIGGGFGHLLVDSVCKRWSVTVLPG
jgi:hypothetical protein